ncbi:MAG: hypothetical protein L6R39_006306 [Caloplaca ligustica]|nr:MAG: hypothetical protein L6R39_006306 [Caloplaca ligustica]
MVKEHVGVQLSPMTSLFELLRWTQSRQATDPRDKVYSLISMATDIRPLPYPPTYKISAATLYFDLAEHMVSQQKGLDILGQCVFQSKGRRNPSWVPDWSKGAMPAFDLGVGTIPYCASGSYACNAVVPKGRKQLLVEGFHYDQIEELSESHMELSSNHAGGKDRELLIPILKKQKVVLQDSLRIVSSSPRYSCEAQRSEAFSRTMVGDRRQDGTQVSKDFERTVWEFRETVDRLIAANIDLDSINILEHGNIETRLVYMASGRRFCLTQSGLVGWVPRDARKGDSVSLLCGSKVPIVLRSKGDAYLVVGQCYIHGIMDGEALIGFTSKFKTMHLA